MARRCVIILLLALSICPKVGRSEEDPATLRGDPTKLGLMTPAAKSELDACVAKASQSAGDEQERRTLFGVYIGPGGHPVSLAVLESSGLDHLDKLVLRCLFRAEYTPTAPGKPPRQWIFKSLSKARQAVQRSIERDRQLAAVD